MVPTPYLALIVSVIAMLAITFLITLRRFDD